MCVFIQEILIFLKVISVYERYDHIINANLSTLSTPIDSTETDEERKVRIRLLHFAKQPYLLLTDSQDPTF